MRVYVLGSVSFRKEMVETKDKLLAMDVNAWIHPHYEEFVRGEREEHLARWGSGSEERAALKRENDYLKVHYKHILESDAILIVNLTKNGKGNYIGGNCLIEMGQAYVNDKRIFLTNDIPTYCSYADEIISMDPICFKGNLESIKNYI